ncbi:heat-shock protein [Sulfurovum riftiae]|uniref:Heat-shock protein n=2 Tax=Sulfurovum riftiae TaxID=1630136 RepID=A0A151CG50_9BACT|nr:heat-shock protein [Sulfurovum riftiae]
MMTPIEEIENALETLGLPKLVTKADIKRQYRYIAKKHHPDLGGDPQEMERINHAYRLLMKYIEEFRYTFDENEVSKQFPGAQHAEQFKP